MCIVTDIIRVANIYLLQQFRDTSLSVSNTVEEWDDAAAVVVQNEVITEDSFIL
jgi:hypothetical protein